MWSHCEGSCESKKSKHIGIDVLLAQCTIKLFLASGITTFHNKTV
jgi:hypothetical protein